MNYGYVLLGIIMSVGLVLGLYRLLKGPHILDRALALDFIGVAGLGALAILAVALEEMVILDLALLLAIVSFVTALAFSHHIARRQK